MKDMISDVLDMTPLEEEEELKRTPVVIDNRLDSGPDAKKLDTDADYARKNLYDLIEKGHSAIDELLAIADQSQHPRSYEVLGTLIKTMVDANKDLMFIHEKKKKLNETSKIESATVTNNSAIFVGSTADLLKQLRNEGD